MPSPVAKFIFVFIKPRRKRKVCVNVAIRKTFTHMVCKILYNQQKNFKQSIKIHTNPLTISAAILIKENSQKITHTISF